MNPADIRGRHDLGEIIGLAWRIYLGNFGAMFPIALTTVPLQMLSAVIQDRIESPETGQLATAPMVLANAIVSVVASAALIHAANDVATKTRPEFARSIDAALACFWRLITTNLLAGLLAIASLIAFPYFVVRWAFAAQAVVIDGKRNWSALDASSSIVKEQWWRTLGIVLVLSLIAVSPLLATSYALLLPALAAATITSVASAFVVPFAVTAMTLLYYDLRARKESAAAMLAADESPALESVERADAASEDRPADQ